MWEGMKEEDRIEGIKSNHDHIYGRDARADRKNATARESQDS